MKKWSVALATASLLALSFIINVQSIVSAAQTADNTTQKNEATLDFFPWDSSGDSFLFSSNGMALPSVYVFGGRGKLNLYRIVYIGNATYMGYYH